MRCIHLVFLQIRKQHTHTFRRLARHKDILQPANEQRRRVDEEGSAFCFEGLVVDPVVVGGAVGVERAGEGVCAASEFADKEVFDVRGEEVDGLDLGEDVEVDAVCGVDDELTIGGCSTKDLRVWLVYNFV